MGPIGIFDSGYGGLTILEGIRRRLPQFDYLYLGDNARTPYGNRSFEVVYQYTLEAVRYLFDRGCPLVILACNTASAKALRSIQQRDLPLLAPSNRVLGVLRPTAQAIGRISVTRKIALVGTSGTILSGSYPLEIHKLFPDIEVFSKACPMWVPLVEYGEHRSQGAFYFVQKDLHELFGQSSDIDTLVLGCTHYPLLLDAIRAAVPQHVRIIVQGELVADSLADYLQRHPEMAIRCSKNGTCRYLTTESASKFEETASEFIGTHLQAEQVNLLT